MKGKIPTFVISLLLAHCCIFLSAAPGGLQNPSGQEIHEQSASQPPSTGDSMVSDSLLTVPVANTELAHLEERLNQAQQHFRHTVIYLLIIICVIMLINLILILFLWRRTHRKITTLAEDQEKTNEALNLHMFDTAEEINSIHVKISGKDQT